MAPGPSFYIVYNLIYLILIIIIPLVTFAFIPFHHTINHFVFCETGEIDNLSTVGGKVYGWVCAGPRQLKVKRHRSSTFTSLLISKSYWFDKPRFVNEGKMLLSTIPPSLGAPPNFANFANSASSYQAVLWRCCRGLWSYSKGSLTPSISLLCFCLACFISHLVYFPVSKF